MVGVWFYEVALGICVKYRSLQIQSLEGGVETILPKLVIFMCIKAFSKLFFFFRRSTFAGECMLGILTLCTMTSSVIHARIMWWVIATSVGELGKRGGCREGGH